MELTPTSPVERGRRIISRIAYGIVLVCLITGLVAYWLGQKAIAAPLFQLGGGSLVTVPVVNLAAVLLEEIRGRDWGFVAAALVVLAMVAYRVAAAL